MTAMCKSSPSAVNEGDRGGSLIGVRCESPCQSLSGSVICSEAKVKRPVGEQSGIISHYKRKCPNEGNAATHYTHYTHTQHTTTRETHRYTLLSLCCSEGVCTTPSIVSECPCETGPRLESYLLPIHNNDLTVMHFHNGDGVPAFHDGHN